MNIIYYKTDIFLKILFYSMYDISKLAITEIYKMDFPYLAQYKHQNV